MYFFYKRCYGRCYGINPIKMRAYIYCNTCNTCNTYIYILHVRKKFTVFTRTSRIQGMFFSVLRCYVLRVKTGLKLDISRV